jgi:hypothetical protein
LKGNKEKKLLITILGSIRRGKKGELQMYNPKLPNREREEIRNNLTIFASYFSCQLLSLFDIIVTSFTHLKSPLNFIFLTKSILIELLNK